MSYLAYFLVSPLSAGVELRAKPIHPVVSIVSLLAATGGTLVLVFGALMSTEAGQIPIDSMARALSVLFRFRDLSLSSLEGLFRVETLCAASGGLYYFALAKSLLRPAELRRTAGEFDTAARNRLANGRFRQALKLAAMAHDREPQRAGALVAALVACDEAERAVETVEGIRPLLGPDTRGLHPLQLAVQLSLSEPIDGGLVLPILRQVVREEYTGDFWLANCCRELTNRLGAKAHKALYAALSSWERPLVHGWTLLAEKHSFFQNPGHAEVVLKQAEADGSELRRTDRRLGLVVSQLQGAHEIGEEQEDELFQAAAEAIRSLTCWIEEAEAGFYSRVDSEECQGFLLGCALLKDIVILFQEREDNSRALALRLHLSKLTESSQQLMTESFRSPT